MKKAQKKRQQSRRYRDALAILNAFERAVRGDEMRGSMMPDEAEQARRFYVSVKGIMRKLLQVLSR